MPTERLLAKGRTLGNARREMDRPVAQSVAWHAGPHNRTGLRSLSCGPPGVRQIPEYAKAYEARWAGERVVE